MKSGRRGFLKGLTSILAGLTVAGKLKAQETAKITRYPEKFKENSIKTKIKGYAPSGQYCFSGISLTGQYYEPMCVTGWVSKPDDDEILP